jgi:hypothetical protein
MFFCGFPFNGISLGALLPCEVSSAVPPCSLFSLLDSEFEQVEAIGAREMEIDKEMETR